MKTNALYPVISVMMLMPVLFMAQTTYTFIGNGNWSSVGNWAIPNGRPSSPLPSGDQIIIAGNCTFNVNNFRIDAGASMTINPSRTLTIQSGRTLRNFGTINVNGALDNGGTLLNRGTINGNIQNSVGATISGNGTISGNLNNNGILDLETGALWTFTITGNYTASSTAQHKIEIRNNASGTNPQSDLISVGGTATLAGSITLTIDNPNFILSGDEFIPIVASTRSGTFSSVNLPGNPMDWTTTYTSTNVKFKYSGAPLPIELLYFTGKRVDNAVKLHWRTAAERNNAYVEVQRSRDAKIFEPLRQIPSQTGGFSDMPLDYTFTDERPWPGINYYRLCQVDFDGVAQYHPVIAVLFKEAKSTDITLFPTLVSDQLHFALSKEIETEGELRISDLNGRLYLRLPLEIGAQQCSIPVNQLPAGHYCLAVQTERIIQTARFVKR